MNDLSGYFRDLYAADADPWGFESRWYEERKRAITLAALPAQRYGSALELGCSIGVLTAQLAPRCDALVATDFDSTALDQARARLEGASNVEFVRSALPDEWPDGRFDLILMSEVGYFLTEEALRRVAARIVGSLAPSGVLLLCHWRPAFDPAPLDGDRVHRIIREATGYPAVVHHEEDDFLLDVLSPDAVSVARRTGLRD
ncbi:class I SAM-dependent DNA methyltransferase [Naasia lichenicola]|uniref:Methyltransferase domain-containing protein n=1 Tax=Naasia lichenicola TaxID=2565933 RepID=A0A4S4FIJ0_9MICO|nr:SAM-dependent methyltransferase [Naasia lichenicola]THG29921.1 methyltransferase domain-containing protein [Naasia lichenicola]